MGVFKGLNIVTPFDSLRLNYFFEWVQIKILTNCMSLDLITFFFSVHSFPYFSTASILKMKTSVKLDLFFRVGQEN